MVSTKKKKFYNLYTRTYSSNNTIPKDLGSLGDSVTGIPLWTTSGKRSYSYLRSYSDGTIKSSF
ncbi:hypothetical protein HYW75_06300 [Candidatus Pacearchaeota archaeon]|nr:hypothetical protein [Candidatus Pacearchaeota archaeon]